MFWMCHILVLAQRHANPSHSPSLSLGPPPEKWFGFTFEKTTIAYGHSDSPSLSLGPPPEKWFGFTFEKTTIAYGHILSNSYGTEPQITRHVFVK
jgi:hypothetical protein